MGLPLSLENAGAVLGLEEQKLKEGKDLIRYFCVPCKATKANGGRTRNLPGHDPEKWRRFKAYNKRDVESEMSIQKRLSRYPVPDFVWDEYHIDQEINDRGIALDMTLVRNAIRIDGKSREKLTAAMRELTELDNPNSIQQMKFWLAENGLETDTLGKKAVSELLKTAPEPLRAVLTLRQQLAKSSVKKYTAMETTVCPDGRARGMFQFYGANRSGRWAGRHIQLQNLPQNHMPDLEQARSLVRDGDFEALNMLYDSVPEVLSELIRTAFIPRDGCKYIVSDLGINKFNIEGYYDPTTYEALSVIEKEEREVTKMFRPLVYICSPFSGDIERNRTNARRYSRYAVNAGYIPLAPHLLFPQFLDDTNPEERSLGLFFGNVLMDKCSEMWVFGGTVSKGMAAEIARAKRKHIPLRYFTEELKEESRP